MFKTIICSMMLLGVALESAVADGDTGREKMIRKTYTPLVKKAMPAAYVAFEKSFKHTFGMDDTKAAIDLIRTVRSVSEKQTEPIPQEAIADACRASWGIALRTWKNSTDEKARQAIMVEWGRSLERKDRYVPFQICALALEWDRAFLTEAFWGPLERARRKEAIQAICYVVYAKGNKQDSEKLLSARRTAKNVEIAGILQNALNWIRYRDDPDDPEPNPGPAAGAPGVVRTLAEAEDKGVQNGVGHKKRVPYAQRVLKELQERRGWPASGAQPESPSEPSSSAQPAQQAEADPQLATTETAPPQYAKRKFNSKLSFEVCVQRSDGGWFEILGTTPAAKALLIPASHMWYVEPSAQTPTEDLIRKLREQSIPGLKLFKYREPALGEVLTRLNSLPDLRLLNLLSSQVTDAGLEHLKGLKQLRNLSLWGAPVTDAGLEHLKGLQQLRNLSLSDTKVTGAELEHLKGLQQLQVLSLSGPHVTGAGLEHLEGLQRLRVLSLSGPQVTDAGLEHLKGLQQLQELKLSKTQVTDAGLKHLKGLKQLRRLHLRNTQVTGAGVDSLRKAIPGLWVCR